MGIYDFTKSTDRLNGRIKFLEKSSLRLRRGSLVGNFTRLSTSDVSALLVQDLTKVKRANIVPAGRKSVGLITT